MPGVATWLRLVPAEKLVIVVLCNEDDRLAHTIADEITAKLVSNWKLPPPATPRPSFVPLPELIGTWKGTVETYKSVSPFQLDVASSGEVRVQLSGQPATTVSCTFFEDGYLHGTFKADLDLPEATRRPYVISLSLKLRNGKTLNGAVTARADSNGTMPADNISLIRQDARSSLRVEKDAFVLTQWGELAKQP